MQYRQLFGTTIAEIAFAADSAFKRIVKSLVSPQNILFVLVCMNLQLYRTQG